MPREFKFGQRLLKLNLESEADESVFREIFLDADYMIVNDIIKRASRSIIDVGGHIGLFTMYARGLNERVPIFTYEPEPRNFAALKEHFKINQIENVAAKNVAVADKDGSVPLYVSADSHNHSVVSATGTKVVVPAVSMQTIFEKHLSKTGVDFCDLVKMDCEGAEFEILQSMAPELFKKIGAFYVEYHEYEGRQGRDLIPCFQKNGFKTRLAPSRHDTRFGFILAY